MRVDAATKLPASGNVSYPAVSAGQTSRKCFLCQRPARNPGSFNKRLDRGKRDLTLIIRPHRLHLLATEFS